jgi:hypothetical protein
MVRTMVCNPQNYPYYVLDFVHLPIFLETIKDRVSETGSVSAFRWKEGDTYSGPVIDVSSL